MQNTPSAKITVHLDSHEVPGLTLTSRLIGEYIVFSGSPTGEHQLFVDVTSYTRFLSHWLQYCRAAVDASAVKEA